MGDTDDLRDWLSREKTKSMLVRMAQGVEKWLRTKQIHPFFLPPPNYKDHELGAENISARIEEITSELHCFILEKGPEFQALIFSDQDGIERLIRHAFQNHLLDGVRKVGVDPWRYFYKRSSQVLRESDQFQKSLKSGRFFMFSLKPDVVRRPPLTEEELETITFPADYGLDFQKLCEQKALTSLAKHFCREVSGMRAADIWVDLRDFVNWVSQHVVMPGVEKDFGDTEDGGLIENSAIPQGEGAAHTASPEDAVYAAEIRRLAACFADRLEPEIKSVMYYRDVLDLSWKDIAGRTGHKSPSGPVYAYELGQSRMKAFIRDLRKLSPEDFDPNDFQLFYETFRQILKDPESEP
jgi:hypothetical protein